MYTIKIKRETKNNDLIRAYETKQGCLYQYPNLNDSYMLRVQHHGLGSFNGIPFVVLRVGQCSIIMIEEIPSNDELKKVSLKEALSFSLIFHESSNE